MGTLIWRVISARTAFSQSALRERAGLRRRVADPRGAAITIGARRQERDKRDDLERRRRGDLYVVNATEERNRTYAFRVVEAAQSVAPWRR